MKIAIVTHAFVENDGQGRVNFEVVRGLSAAAHEVTLIAAKVAPALLALPNVRWVEISHGPLPTNLLRNAWFSFGAARALAKLRGQVDLTMANGAITSVPVDVNAVHFVHSGWSASPYYDAGHGLRGLYQRLYTFVNATLEKRAFRRARHIIAVSGQVADEIVTLGISCDKITAIANGVDTDMFTPSSEDVAALDLPLGNMRALFVGDIVSRRKGLDTILAALPGIENLSLIVVGRTRNSPYPNEVIAAGLSDRVTFLDFRRDIPAIMRACDVFVFPSRYEACSLVLFEALGSGLPVITARTTGGAEFLDEAASIKLNDPEDVRALHAALKTLAAEPVLRAQMAERARACARSLTWERMAAQYIALFEDILAQKRAE
ncbi:glycosyltransferase family 4 protein [Albirhodobacter sp. R86504]|uniref:glycosyltransferase family 4 protein n=1 Tax=Albirhodobacter sp. R86504 TaxID=3093848 RepID=UPI003673043F